MNRATKVSAGPCPGFKAVYLPDLRSEEWNMKLRLPRFERNKSAVHAQAESPDLAKQLTAVPAEAQPSAAVAQKPAAPAESTSPTPKPVAPVFGSEELILLNSASLEYLRGLTVTEIERRVAEISVDEIETAAGIEAASVMLEKEGIVIVRNFLDSVQLRSADEAITKVIDALAAATSDRNYESDEILVQSSQPVVSSYSALASHPKAVATIRQGADAGMVDVFNVDRLAGSQRDVLRAPFSGQGILSLMAEGDRPLEAKNLNLYVNRGITQTRGFHADSFGKTLKGFVYLGDVTSLDDGPYCFVRRTHVDGLWRKANQKISELAQARTEAPFVDISMAVPVLASRGSLILSDQAGVHRGMPQAPGAERRVLVMRYR